MSLPYRRTRELCEQYEVEHWMKKFGVGPERLEEAVNVVGNGADAVDRHLKG